MKVRNFYMLMFGVLAGALTSCQKTDNYLIKGEAISISMAGYNNGTADLQILIDTTKLQSYISAGNNFNLSERYSFGDTQDTATLVVKDKDTGKPVYQRKLKKGEYNVVIELIYVDGQLIQKPALPADIANIRQISYLIIPNVTHYAGDVDIVYYKKYEYIENGQFKLEKEEVLAKVTTKPNVFSPFLQAPVFPGGRTEINGKIYFVNPDLRIFKAGTTIPYYEDAGFIKESQATLPIPLNSKPSYEGLIERPTYDKTAIDQFLKVSFN